MKKIVAIFFLMTYGITSVGATVHLHYCMSKLVGWSLSHGKSEKCSKCLMEKKTTKGCCKDEHKYVKASGDQNHQELEAFSGQQFFSPAILTPQYVYHFTRPSVAVALPKNNAPPPKKGVPIYILNQVFRI